MKLLPFHEMIDCLRVKVGVVEKALSHTFKMVEHHTCVQPLQPEFYYDIVECELQCEKKVGRTFRRSMSSMTRWMPNLPGWPTLLLGHFLLYSSNWRDGAMGISSPSWIDNLIEVVRGEVKTNGQEGVFRTLKFRELWPQVLSYNVNSASVTTKICEPPSQRERPGQCCRAWSSCPAWWRQGGRWGQYRTIQTCTWHMEKNKSFLGLIGIQSCQ